MTSFIKLNSINLLKAIDIYDIDYLLINNKVFVNR